MSSYITSVGRSRVNNFSFDIHENKDGSASIRPNKLGHDLPTTTWLTYGSVDEAKDCIEDLCGDLMGADRALFFWKKSGIAEKIEQAKESAMMEGKLSSMSESEQQNYFSQKQYEADTKFVEDNHYFL